jgi:hypothetical protein
MPDKHIPAMNRLTQLLLCCLCGVAIGAAFGAAF